MAAPDYLQWLKRGRRCQKAGRTVDAMLFFRRAQRANPRASDPPFHLGEVFWQLGRATDAIAAWREAAAANPGHLAPNLALAEASLSVGNAADARAAADAALTIDPANARAALLCGIARLAQGDGYRSIRDVAKVLAGNPQLLDVQAIAGPLAVVLDNDPDADGRAEFLAELARAPELLLRTHPLLLALVVEAAVHAPHGGCDLAPLVAVARAHEYGPADHVALRRIAAAVAPADPEAGAALGLRYAVLCADAFALPTPHVWPLRSSGPHTRVLVLLPAEIADGVTRESVAVLAGLPRDAFDLAVATIGRASAAVIDAAATLASPVAALSVAPDPTVGKALAARDFDVLVDLAGAVAAPLLAQRPAREIMTVGAVAAANLPPIVDRALADATALAPALIAVHAAREGRRNCAADAETLASLWNEAVRAHQHGERAVARAAYGRLLELQPGFAPAHYLRGQVVLDDGELEAAHTDFIAALAAAPDFVDARVAAARTAIKAKNAASAAALCEEGLVRRPADVGLWRSLGLAQLALHDWSAAVASFGRALALDPDDGETHYNHGVALQMLRSFKRAARAYRRALLFRPELVDADYNLGVVFQQQGNAEAAIGAYKTVLKLNPTHASAYKNLGEVLLATGRIDGWIANFQRFEANCPHALPLAVQALEAGQYLGDFGRVERYLEGLRQEKFRVESQRQLAECLEALLPLLLYFDVDPEMLLRFAQTYDVTATRVYGTPLALPRHRRPGRLRVGYLSADLCNRALGKMIWQAVAHHDKSSFELHFYALSDENDEWTERFRRLADRFEVIAGLADRDAATRIAAADLDLLVDLSTHTKGARPGILALKPARVQITHVASAGTVGLSAIDYKLTDRWADVPESRAFQIEAPLVMDGCVYPYRHVEPAATHPYHRAPLGIGADTVVIGAFVSGLKLSRRCLALWREVLERIPRARIAFCPAHAGERALYLRLAAAADIPANRLLFLPQCGDDAECQARYMIVDFVLDTMPCGGTSETIEALDVGVPVVTLAGRRHGERASYSILSNLGVTETVAHSGREFVEIAVRLADDAAFMSRVRAAIRERLAASPLTDMAGHTRHLEAAYLAALQERCPDVLAAARSGDD